jgi:uncharacterized protein
MDPETKHCNLFPLGIFVLPGGFAALHIFEERFKTLVQRALQRSEPFGILATIPENEPNLGTLVRVVEVTKRYPDGRMDILVKGESLFQLVDFVYANQDHPYPFGTITPKNHLRNLPVTAELAADFKQYAVLYANITGEDLELAGTLRLLDIAGKLQLDEEDKLKLALYETPEQQMRFLQNQISYLHTISSQEQFRYMGFYLS